MLRRGIYILRVQLYEAEWTVSRYPKKQRHRVFRLDFSSFVPSTNTIVRSFRLSKEAGAAAKDQSFVTLGFGDIRDCIEVRCIDAEAFRTSATR